MIDCQNIKIKLMESQNNNQVNNALLKAFSKTNKKQVIVQDSDSDWSMASLQQIKGQNLKEIIDDDHDLQNQQNNNEVHTNTQKNKKQIKVVFPEKPFVGEASVFTPFGRIISHVGQLIIVESFPKQSVIKHFNQTVNDPNQIVVDLDNWLFDQEKNIIGFVMDVLGKIDHPFYVIKSQVQDQKMPKQFPVGIYVYYVQGSKILRQQDISSIMSKTAMDVENLSDQSDEENLSEGQLQLDKLQESQNNNNRGRNNGPRDFNRRFQQRKAKEDYRQEYSAQNYPSNRHNRSRTRQHLRSRRTLRQENQHQNGRRSRQYQNNQQANQAYLNDVYSVYHQQMMHLQYGSQIFNPTQLQNPMPLIYSPPNYTIPPNYNPNTHPNVTNNNRNQNFNGSQQKHPF